MIGIVVVACFAARVDCVPAATIASTFNLTRSEATFRELTHVAVGISIFKDDILTFPVSELPQSRSEGFEVGSGCFGGRALKYSDFRKFFRLLHLSWKHQRKDHSGESKTENCLTHYSRLTPSASRLSPYRMTRSARTSTFGGS
jgi:hypothetical protein